MRRLAPDGERHPARPLRRLGVLERGRVGADAREQLDQALVAGGEVADLLAGFGLRRRAARATRTRGLAEEQPAQCRDASELVERGIAALTAERRAAAAGRARSHPDTLQQEPSWQMQKTAPSRASPRF
jgi:hypothetical protein